MPKLPTWAWIVIALVAGYFVLQMLSNQAPPSQPSVQ